MEIDGKKLVITGASSGIGRALLQELSGRQLKVVAAGRDEARLQDAVTSARVPQTEIMPFTGDLAKKEGVDALFAYALQQMGGIDFFFANAGFAFWEWVEEPAWRRMEAIYRTNVFSPIYAVQKMHALFPGADYRVVITSSILGRVGLEGYALYSSTKAALDRFAEVYRLETGRPGRLVLVYPLAVRSGFLETAGGAPTPWLSQSPEAAARGMVRGIERDRETIYTSWILPPMLLANHLLPFTRRWYQALDGRVASRHRGKRGQGASQGEAGQSR
jgi:NAD(P)-dependent dehydrogenase (short-subunit alcohol dehydrogenase family)